MGSKEPCRGDICSGCHQIVSLESPGVIICPDCLTGRYCNEDCERSGREEHKSMCRQLALRKLKKINKSTLGRYGVDRWVQAVMLSLRGGVLPDCCTEKQLDELSVLWPRVYSMIDPDPNTAYKMLIVGIRYAMCVTRPAAIVERLVHDSCELLKAIPPASEEEGAEMWGTENVLGLCINVGELLGNMDKPKEAIEFVQWVKPNLDVAVLLKRPPEEDDSDGSLFYLVNLYRSYAGWVKQCMPGRLTMAEYRDHPDRQKRVELLKQAIKMGKGLKETVAWCGYDLGIEYVEADEIDLALPVFQKSLKVPWNDCSGRIAANAVKCHIMAGRDTQAGKWIDQLLRLEKHCPGRLGRLGHAVLYSLRGLLYRRMGETEEALYTYGAALEILWQLKRADVNKHEVDAPLIDVTMDQAECLEDLGQTHDKMAEFLERMAEDGVRRPLEDLHEMRRLLDGGQEAEALAMLERFNDQMVRGSGRTYWRWRLKGVTLWGMEMLSKWEGLVMQLLPEGERRAAVLARIEELRGVETMIKQKLLDDRRAQAIVEVREQVTGKPAAEGEGILEGTGEATGEAAANHKPNKVARKKRKKRQKKAAQAQHDSSQQGAEAGLEQSMAGLEITQEGEASEGEGEMDAGGKQPAVVSEKEECAICLNELGGEEGEDEKGLVCGHVMHASCLRCWASKCASLSIETTCPVCREAVVEELSN